MDEISMQLINRLRLEDDQPGAAEALMELL